MANRFALPAEVECEGRSVDDGRLSLFIEHVFLRLGAGTPHGARRYLAALLSRVGGGWVRLDLLRRLELWPALAAECLVLFGEVTGCRQRLKLMDWLELAQPRLATACGAQRLLTLIAAGRTWRPLDVVLGNTSRIAAVKRLVEAGEVETAARILQAFELVDEYVASTGRPDKQLVTCFAGTVVEREVTYAAIMQANRAVALGLARGVQNPQWRACLLAQLGQLEDAMAACERCREGHAVEIIGASAFAEGNAKLAALCMKHLEDRRAQHGRLS